MLTDETISRFRQNYRAAFGAVTGGDPLYEAVSEGRRFAGMEHWLPFFYEQLETLFDYLPERPSSSTTSPRRRSPTGWRRCATITRRAATPPGRAPAPAPRPTSRSRPKRSISRATTWRSALADRRHARSQPLRRPPEEAARRSTSAGAPGAPSPPSAPPATSTSSTRSSRTSPQLKKAGRKVDARLLERGRARPPGPGARRPWPDRR